MSFMTFPDTETRTAQHDTAAVSLVNLYADLFAASLTPWTWMGAWWQPWMVVDVRLEGVPGFTAPVVAPAPHGPSATDGSAASPEVIEVVPVVVVADDLTRIEGIGPKLALKLAEAGITTFAALAATPVERLEALIAAAGARFKLARPQTWPEQAALLAAGDDAGFAALAAQLKGGVRA